MLEKTQICRVDEMSEYREEPHCTLEMLRDSGRFRLYDLAVTIVERI